MRNLEIGATIALMELSKAGDAIDGHGHSSSDEPQIPTEFNPLTVLSDNIDAVDEARLIEIRAQAQAILAKIGQRLDKNSAEAVEMASDGALPSV